MSEGKDPPKIWPGTRMVSIPAVHATHLAYAQAVADSLLADMDEWSPAAKVLKSAVDRLSMIEQYMIRAKWT